MNSRKDVVIASQEVIDQILRIEEKVDIIYATLSTREQSDVILTGEEARKMLNVCPATWQKMRDNRKIAFSQVGRKIYVRKSDVEEYLRIHLINNK